jgi:ribokinase
MKIVNFGSLNNDFIYMVNHFVRPGETLRAAAIDNSVGGKGLNQSIAAARAGAIVMHVGKIGDDGNNLTDALRQEGVDISFVEQSNSKSGHAIIQVDKSGQNSIIIYGGANLDIDKGLIDRAFMKIDSEDIILIQNEISNTPYLMEKAHERGNRLAFNPSPITEDIMNYPLEYVSWFVLNETEGKALIGAGENDEITKSLITKFPGSAVVLTLGEKGVMYLDAEKALYHGIYEVEAVDTTGAGDTFTGYFLAGITKGLSIEENLRLASIASSITVSRKGASPSIPVLKEVLNFNLP